MRREQPFLRKRIDKIRIFSAVLAFVLAFGIITPSISLDAYATPNTGIPYINWRDVCGEYGSILAGGEALYTTNKFLSGYPSLNAWNMMLNNRVGCMNFGVVDPSAFSWLGRSQIYTLGYPMSISNEGGSGTWTDGTGVMPAPGTYGYVKRTKELIGQYPNGIYRDDIGNRYTNTLVCDQIALAVSVGEDLGLSNYATHAAMLNVFLGFVWLGSDGNFYGTPLGTADNYVNQVTAQIYQRMSAYGRIMWVGKSTDQPSGTPSAERLASAIGYTLPVFDKVPDSSRSSVSYSNLTWSATTVHATGSNDEQIWLRRGANVVTWSEPIGSVKVIKTSVDTTMTDGNGCYSLAGAVYGIYSDSACTALVGELTTDASGVTATLDLNPGTYYVKETISPSTYALNSQIYTATISSGTTTTVNTSDRPLNDPIVIRIRKVASDGATVKSATLVGAQFTVNYYAGQYTADALPASPTRSWVIETKEENGLSIATLDAEHLVSGDALYTNEFGHCTIPLGTVSIKETLPPPGYVVKNSAFTVNGSPVGTAYVANIVNQDGLAVFLGSYEMDQVENISRFEILKTDASGTPLGGASLQVVDDVGKAVDSWTSTDTAHEIKGLTVGKTYTLRELTPPDGYATAADVTFIVRDDDQLQTVSMADQITQTYIEKLDSSGKPIANAVLTLSNQDGLELDRWTTEDTAHLITMLTVGDEYTITEVSTPDGYVTASPVKFTVADTPDVQVIKMTDYKVSVQKLTANKTALSDVELSIYRDGETAPVECWTTDGTAHFISGLIQGQSYILRETKTPEGYCTAKDISFTPGTEDLTLTMTDKVVTIIKTDTDSNPLSGAKLAILDSNGETVDSWTTTTDFHTVVGLKVGVSYTLRELRVPAGYTKAEDIPFTVDDNGKDQALTMKNKHLIIDKVDASGESLTGARLRLSDAAGTELSSWLSNGTPNVINNLLVGATYTVEELEAPDGYVCSLPKSFTIANDGLEQVVNIPNRRLSIMKTDKSGNLISGASLEIRNADNEIIDSWISEAAAHYAVGLKDGETYTLLETSAPSGYRISAPVTFTVDVSSRDQTVTMVDETLSISITKVNANGELLSGAALKLTDKETGNQVDLWTSSVNSPHLIRKVTPGKSYILEEVSAPSGYAVAAPIEFVMEDNGKDTEIIMTDKKVSVIKQNAVGGPISGAKLSLSDKESGEMLAQWTTTEEARVLTNLAVGKTYVLTEEQAPEGFAKASDLEFTVTDDNKDQLVVMIDIFVSISKQDETGTELADAELTLTDGVSGDIVDVWVTTDTPHIPDGLSIGGKYILTETHTPDGFATASPIEFTVANDPENQTVHMVDKQTTVSIAKVNTKEETVSGAELSIRDKETDEIIDSWCSTAEPHIIKGLVVGKTYILSEVSAPVGYKPAESIEFTVSDTEEVQSITIVNEFDPGVGQIDKVDAMFGTPVSGAVVTIVDKTDGTSETVTSDTNGYVFFNILPGHTYEYREIEAPEGYLLNSETFTLTVSDTLTISGPLTLKNAPIGTVVLLKYASNTGKSLSGAELTVNDAHGNEVYRGITDEMGRIYFPIPSAGQYTYTETAAPEGYSLNSSRHVFYVDENGAVTGDTKIANTPKQTGAVNTGDDGSIIIYSLFAVTLLGGGFSSYFVYRKRKKASPDTHETDKE